MTSNRCIYCKVNPPREDQRACGKFTCQCQMQLSEIPGLYVLASAFLTPGSGGKGSSSGERTIGVNVNALEYRIALDLLAIISGWEVEVRDCRQFSEMAAVTSYEDRITNACKFLLSQFDWIVKQDFFGDFAREIQDMHAKGLAATRQMQIPARRIECPADLGDGLCLSLLTLPEGNDNITTIKCPKCRTKWTLDWLIEVALATKGSEYWLDAESIANHLQMDHREVRRFARKWKIAKRGQLYDLTAFIEERNKSRRDTPKIIDVS